MLGQQSKVGGVESSDQNALAGIDSLCIFDNDPLASMHTRSVQGLQDRPSEIDMHVVWRNCYPIIHKLQCLLK